MRPERTETPEKENSGGMLLQWRWGREVGEEKVSERGGEEEAVERVR